MDEVVDTWIDKSAWPDGPWQHEPDRIEWRIGDLVGLVLRANPRSGVLCGYVGLPPGHPWHGRDYNDIGVVDVHGGLTFAEACMEDDRPQRERVCHVPRPGESDAMWWLGFDCHHMSDLAPGYPDEIAEILRTVDLRYRDVAYVRAEVEHLAEQAQAATKEEPCE